MFVYRVVKTKARTNDLSGTGAFQWGGRWNNKGTYMLYTSANSSLALLENLVHFDESDFPPQLFIVQLEIKENTLFYTPADREYPANWKQPEFPENKHLGDRWMNEFKYLGIQVRSVVNELEYNLLLNPKFPGYNQLVKITQVTKIDIDERLLK